MLPILTLTLMTLLVFFIFAGNSKRSRKVPESGKKRQDPRQPGRHPRGRGLPALPQTTTKTVGGKRQHCSPKILQSN